MFYKHFFNNFLMCKECWFSVISHLVKQICLPSVIFVWPCFLSLEKLAWTLDVTVAVFEVYSFQYTNHLIDTIHVKAFIKQIILKIEVSNLNLQTKVIKKLSEKYI